MKEPKETVGEWQTPLEYRRKQEQWSKELLLFSVWIFLCISSSLTLVAVMSNFTLTYQARNLLVEIATSKDQEIPTTLQQSFPTSGSTFSTVSVESTSQSTLSNADTTTTIEATSTTGKVSSIPPTNGSSVVPTSSGTPGTPNKRNPISLLNELHQKKASYLCMERCKSPSVIAANLNLCLSANGKEDNYLHLTIPVCTLSGKVAKRRAAYYALGTLYKDYVDEAETDEDWDVRVPAESECKTNGTHVWMNCND